MKPSLCGSGEGACACDATASRRVRSHAHLSAPTRHAQVQARLQAPLLRSSIALCCASQDCRGVECACRCAPDSLAVAAASQHKPLPRTHTTKTIGGAVRGGRQPRGRDEGGAPGARANSRARRGGAAPDGRRRAVRLLLLCVCVRQHVVATACVVFVRAAAAHHIRATHLIALLHPNLRQRRRRPTTITTHSTPSANADA